jgi:hypothetical protein
VLAVPEEQVTELSVEYLVLTQFLVELLRLVEVAVLLTLLNQQH